MKNPFFSTKTNIKYQRQHETTIDNYVLVFWQTCQNVFLLQFSRFAKLTSLSCSLVVKVVFFNQSPLLSVFFNNSLSFILHTPYSYIVGEKLSDII